MGTALLLALVLTCQQSEAKAAHRNVSQLFPPLHTSGLTIFSKIWKDYDEAAEAVEAPQEDSAEPLKSEYLDVIVSDIRPKNDFAFSVQILNTEGT